METSPTAEGGGPKRRVIALLGARRLPLWLALLAMALTAPSLFIGLHLDDYVHRFLLLGYPGAAELGRSYVSPFAIANGDPGLNHWLIEHGYAPWWTYDRLLLSFFRPLSAATHRIDYALWPDSPVLMHAHSLLWFGGVVAAACVAYRRILGHTTVAGLAAALYAVDHTHGFPVGWVANRNALPPVLLGLATIALHDRGRRGPSALAAWLAPATFLAGLLGGEVTLGALAFVLAHAASLDPGTSGQRVRAVLPYVAITIAWRAVYNHLGYGARGSGLYLDPVHEPLTFAVALFQRVPLLVMGALGLPPAEAYYFVPGLLGAAIFAGAVLLLVAAVVAFTPMVRRDPAARFFAIGAVLALPLACTAYPHNRLLFFVSFGAMGLVAELLHAALTRATWFPTRIAWHLVAQPFLAGVAVIHVLLSPLILPLAASGIVTTRGITEKAVPSAIAAMRSPEDHLVVVDAPDYFFVNLVPILQALHGKPGPAKLRMLSIGPVPVTVRRLDAHRLRLDYEGGLLASPLTQLYRNARLPMTVGTRVELDGLTVELVAVTPDGRPAAAEFTFAEALEWARYRWLRWGKDTFVPFEVPAVGGEVRLEPAELKLEL